MKIYDKALVAAEYLRKRSPHKPLVGIIQGTGLSNLHTAMTDVVEIAYQDIPNMPLPSVPSHSSKCYLGKVGGVDVIAFAGRLHYYEGYAMGEVTFPVRVMQALGVAYLLMSNASGGLNATYCAGDLVVIKDHISTFPDNPLRGLPDERLGVQFPDMSNAYDRDVRRQVRDAFAEERLRYVEGVYLGLPGPSLETPAEYKMFGDHGADMLGMSTVPEVIVANQAGIKTAVVSVVTNVFDPKRREPTTIEEVLVVVAQVEPTLIKIISKTITNLQA